MRLDKFLKNSRIIKRRTVANEVCDAGKVNVNGKIAKASYDVKIGDIVEIIYGSRLIRFRIDDIKDVVKKEEASDLYTML